MTRRHLHGVVLLLSVLALAPLAQGPARDWLPGDSHVHSHWSPGYDRTQSPPVPLKGEDARYSTPQNATMARRFGLTWMVTTDHGGPNHSKFNLHQAYNELLQSRELVPDLFQFYGMELNMPAMDHHTLIVPRAQDEWAWLFEIERRFDANEAWPDDAERRTESAALAALAYMQALPRPPLVFANHPSRSARGIGAYGLDEPRELRNNHDQAPSVYRGMEGAPGHQAAALVRLDADDPDAGERPGARGSYRNPGAHTIGGFDQMTAIVGGLWDALLGEGRRFWIVATSDSHVHYSEADDPGADFWPGEYQKTYVYASRSYDDILDGLRNGRVFVTSGDLITDLDVTASVGARTADIGGTLRAARGDAVEVSIRFRDPDSPNAAGLTPRVARVDVIAGQVLGVFDDRNTDRNPTTRVIARMVVDEGSSEGGLRQFVATMSPLDGPMYVRVRGTSTGDLEPPMDAPGEDPWGDLWFYSNPIFIDVD